MSAATAAPILRLQSSATTAASSAAGGAAGMLALIAALPDALLPVCPQAESSEARANMQTARDLIGMPLIICSWRGPARGAVERTSRPMVGPKDFCAPPLSAE